LYRVQTATRLMVELLKCRSALSVYGPIQVRTTSTREAAPEWRRARFHCRGSVHEASPTGGEDCPRAGPSGEDHLLLDLVRGEQVIRVQPLDLIARAVREGGIPRGGGATVFLTHYAHAASGEFLGDSQRAVFGAVVNDHDLRVRPCLSDRGLQRQGNPLFGVVRRNTTIE
jgi:hypothetical protein